MTARKAFEALLRVSLLQPTSSKYNTFAEQVRKIAKQKYDYTFYEGEEVRWEIVVNLDPLQTVKYSYPRCTQVNFFIGAFYDGVLLLGMTLNETLTEGGNIHDGVALTRKM